MHAARRKCVLRLIVAIPLHVLFLLLFQQVASFEILFFSGLEFGLDFFRIFSKHVFYTSSYHQFSVVQQLPFASDFSLQRFHCWYYI